MFIVDFLSSVAEPPIAGKASYHPNRESPSQCPLSIQWQRLSRAVRQVCLRWLAVTLRLQEHSIPEIGTLMGWSSKRAENLVNRAW